MLTAARLTSQLVDAISEHDGFGVASAFERSERVVEVGTLQMIAVFCNELLSRITKEQTSTADKWTIAERASSTITAINVGVCMSAVCALHRDVLLLYGRQIDASGSSTSTRCRATLSLLRSSKEQRAIDKSAHVFHRRKL